MIGLLRQWGAGYGGSPIDSGDLSVKREPL